MRPESTPWFGAALRGPEEARQACELADRLEQSRPADARGPRGAHVAGEVGLRSPATYPDAVAMMQLLTSIQASLRMLSAGVYAADPGRLAIATGAGTGLGFRDRRALRKQGHSLVVESVAGGAAGVGGAGGQARSAVELTDEDLSAAFTHAADELARWEQLRVDDGLPRLPARLDELLALWADCEAQLDVLRRILSLPADPLPLLTALAADQDTAWKLPRLYELATRFGELCLGPLLDELGRREAGPDLAADAFDHAWYSAILDQMRVLDPRYAADQGGALDEIAGDFRAHDVHHLTANRARVRRAWAQALLDASDRHPLQARVIRKQAALRRGHVPLRRLLDQASDVLFAIKPCWAMSPLMVSQVLPVARLFDVVIFDEASQIVPADAIPAIMRGHQIVVAGDDRQLPPTNFFHQVGDPDEESADDEDLVSFGAGFESVLDALRPLLPTAPLAWHYRSRDERLVAFSNSRVYGGALTTFPGVFTGDCLRHVVVAQGPGRGQETSVDAEVSKVVDLILEHAREHPRESLGVIALGIKHAERIDAALRTALTRLSDVPDGGETGPADVPGSGQAGLGQAGLGQAGLEAFFAEDVPEPFFVKNLERVQGDERDAIILSIGYGKHPDGRMRYQWGPLLRDGGERRLNVAATRAKHRLTVVSSFSGHDVDPDRVTKAGARMLAEYLDYASSGGTAPEASGAMQLDAFEADVRSRLAEAGIRVVAQYGVGGYRVDFAATHPQDPGRMVLAIEADGASYRKSGSVRDRDRLRGEHLQRLGWHYHRLWSTNWFRNPDAEVAKIREAYLRAISTIKPESDEATRSWPDGSRLGATPSGTVSPGTVSPGTVRPDAARLGAPAPGRPTAEVSQPNAADPGRSLPDGSAAGGSRAAVTVPPSRQLAGGPGQPSIEPIRRRELPSGSQNPRELS